MRAERIVPICRRRLTRWLCRRLCKPPSVRSSAQIMQNMFIYVVSFRSHWLFPAAVWLSLCGALFPPFAIVRIFGGVHYRASTSAKEVVDNQTGIVVEDIMAFLQHGRVAKAPAVTPSPSSTRATAGRRSLSADDRRLYRCELSPHVAVSLCPNFAVAFVMPAPWWTSFLDEHYPDEVPDEVQVGIIVSCRMPSRRSSL